jgi:hypothetical protein
MKTIYHCCLLICILFLSTIAMAQASVYNSYPSASATVFLDFDGAKVEGTSWNANGPLNCAPSNLNATQIKEIFNRVAEDYRPFNLNITTDSLKYLSAPVNQRMRIVLTITSDWYGSAGGVSFVNSFTWGDNTPAFVFTALLNYNTKYIAEATAHELGHTLGLRHQSSYDNNCIKTAEYNPGIGTGEIGWAPIMGVGYYKNFTLWNNGANPYGCTSFQDDLGIITSSNGFGYRPDDHNNEANTSATNVDLSTNQFDIDGVIEKISDRDVFRFNLPVAGSLHIDAIPFNLGSNDAGSNLDIEIQLLNTSQSILGTYNPDQLLSASVDTMLQAGNYYLRVAGKGNINAPEYASIGSYSLKGFFLPATPLPIHRLELHGITENNKHLLDWVIEADETVVDQVLETSATGQNFEPLSELNATTRVYQNQLNINTRLLYYRLNVTFDNGQRMYSNIVSLRGRPSSKPSLDGNVVHHQLETTSPSVYNYTIFDYSGRVMTTGRLIQGINTINTTNFIKGMYIIRFTNGIEVNSEKFMKE